MDPVVPRKLHFIWVGDESKRPDAYIATWKRQHPDFDVRVWGNRDWQERDWINKDHMDRISRLDRGLAGVADLMRWEILLSEGGFALDADSVCLEPLPQWIFSCDLFALWENERTRPGLVANGYVGARPGHEVIRSVVMGVHDIRDITRHFVWKKLRYKKRKVWQTTGPVPFTRAISAAKSNDITILPSHFFLPVHHSGDVYTGNGPVYSCEFFAGTKAAYGEMTETDPDKLVTETKARLKVLIKMSKCRSEVIDP
ncbi:MAG: glycosyltransferase family 32 protein [Marinobacter sp.]|uniref:glycosyltransferase family 32 protein n=1 Tax=Marinobacter sp. TaxID=50741 RepID=UPI003C40582A